MSSNFLGWIYRQRFIKRWNRMDNQCETDIELHSHCLNVSIVAHLLAEIDNKIFGKNHHSERVAMLGIYHEIAETVSGDFSTPIKNYNKAIAAEIKGMENSFERLCVNSLPCELQSAIGSFIVQSEVEPESKKLVKCADDLVAYFKCKQEVHQKRNEDFIDALDNLRERVEIHAEDNQCVRWFLDNFNEGYTKTIDKLIG